MVIFQSDCLPVNFSKLPEFYLAVFFLEDEVFQLCDLSCGLLGPDLPVKMHYGATLDAT
jgi:hypothetical protein